MDRTKFPENLQDGCGLAKIVILAGGQGTRFSEETENLPKPLIEVGNYPIIWHIMKHYAHYGFNDFLIALGYRGDQVKRYFADYSRLQGSIAVDFRSREVRPLEPPLDLSWFVELVETGARTGSGGRMKRLKPYLQNDTFMMTYCDGVSDIDLGALLRFHKSHGKLATLTAVQPAGRFGRLDICDGSVTAFSEKAPSDSDWVNGGFFVLEPGVLDYVDSDDSDWAHDVLPVLADAGQLMAYKHESFWQCMDTRHDRSVLQTLWNEGAALWKSWE
jgi:glucose-1-phosphate cytidylyltransferase